MARCVHCARPISGDEDICPICGGEQPVEWMVKLVHVLVFLFFQGAIYRLIWPKADSLLHYGVYFAATSLLACVGLVAFRRIVRRESGGPSVENHHDALED